MQWRIQPFDPSDPIQLESLVDWECDRELFNLTVPVKHASHAETYFSREQLLNSLEEPNRTDSLYILFDDLKPIGSISIQMNPPQLFDKSKNSGWLGLTIGNRDYWGTGAAQYAMKFFESESKKFGAQRFELGVFEFNTRAQAFYRKMGYTELARIKNFTFFDGRYWDDIRMEKHG